MLNNMKVIKGIGITATIIGLGITLISDWVKEKELNAKIIDEVNKAFESYFPGD